MYRQMLARSSFRQAVAWTALATAGTYTLMPSRTLRLEGDQNSLLDTVKEKAHEAKEGLQARNPLKPESPAGVAGAKTSVNPNTSINHGQASFGETAAPHDVGVVAAAEKKRQAASGNPTTNEQDGEAKQGGGAGAKIASGHAEDGTPHADLGEKKKKKKKGKKSKKAKQEGEETPASPTGEAARATAATGAGLTAGVGQGFQEKEDEASQEQAFDEETGEINWDCPCLGGMAHGPCGEKFKAAFSCFVYSKEEPKGKECLDKFRGMQECFKEHPEVYGSLVDDDETTEGKMVETEASS